MKDKAEKQALRMEKFKTESLAILRYTIFSHFDICEIKI